MNKMTFTKTLWRVVASYFVAGLIVDDHDTVVAAAPILRWAEGKTRVEVATYCDQKGWTLHRVGGKL